MKLSRIASSGVVVAGALAFGLTGTPALQAVFGVLALANVAELISRRVPDTDAVARGLFAVMGLLVLAIVLGLVLGEAPGHLSRANWAVGWAVVGVALTAVVTVTERQGSHREVIPSPQVLACVLLVLAGTAGGVVLAWQGLRHDQRQPLLALSAPWHSSTQARVVVQAASIGGRYALRVLPDGDPGRSVESGTVTLRAGGDESVSRQLVLPAASTHWNVVLTTLSPQPQVERELILWKST